MWIFLRALPPPDPDESPPFNVEATIQFNMLSVKNRTKLIKVSNSAAKVMGLPTLNLIELNNRAITRIAISKEQDSTHLEHLARYCLCSVLWKRIPPGDNKVKSFVFWRLHSFSYPLGQKQRIYKRLCHTPHGINETVYLHFSILYQA